MKEEQGQGKEKKLAAEVVGVKPEEVEGIRKSTSMNRAGWFSDNEVYSAQIGMSEESNKGGSHRFMR